MPESASPTSTRRPGEPFAWVACADAAEIEHAVEAAAFAAKLWRGAPFDERARRLGAARRASARASRGARRASSRSEQGKPFAEALALEVLPSLDHLRFLSRHARELTQGEPIEPRHPLYAHKRALYLYDPLGVVVLVTSSSLPFAQPLIQTASALAMGNAVILKPSSIDAADRPARGRAVRRGRIPGRARQRRARRPGRTRCGSSRTTRSPRCS